MILYLEKIPEAVGPKPLTIKGKEGKMRWNPLVIHLTKDWK